MSRLFLLSALTTLALVAGQTASATPVTFFGQDLNTGGDPFTVSPVMSTVARNSFFTNLTGVGTETFESIAVGTSVPFGVSFPGAGTATILTGGMVASGNDGSGRYTPFGSNYLNAGRSAFNINFSTPIAAFGFFGVDIGDFGGQLTLTLTDTLSNTSSLLVPNTIGSGGNTSGSILYFGFYDTGRQYTSISFGNNSGGADVFAFDNFSVGGFQQVTPGVPEASTWAMMLAGFAGLGFLGLRSSRSRATAA